MRLRLLRLLRQLRLLRLLRLLLITGHGERRELVLEVLQVVIHHDSGLRSVRLRGRQTVGAALDRSFVQAQFQREATWTKMDK